MQSRPDDEKLIAVGRNGRYGLFSGGADHEAEGVEDISLVQPRGLNAKLGDVAFAASPNDEKFIVVRTWRAKLAWKA